ncbi:MAG: four helix bundle protein [Thermoflexales bacterium]|nr:four helix bundle protein [Thermoflexales bacterium]
MTYEEWLQSVPPEITADPLWQMRVYRLALFAGDLGWHDVSILAQDARTRGLADQLYRALGSIAANIVEGYSRHSGKERARFYEYALGSAREARTWYYEGRHGLRDAVVDHRLRLLTQIVRLLLSIIPAERETTGILQLREGSGLYLYSTDPDTELSQLLSEVPMP